MIIVCILLFLIFWKLIFKKEYGKFVIKDNLNHRSSSNVSIALKCIKSDIYEIDIIDSSGKIKFNSPEMIFQNSEMMLDLGEIIGVRTFKINFRDRYDNLYYQKIEIYPKSHIVDENEYPITIEISDRKHDIIRPILKFFKADGKK